jgi:hypothetical protein
MLQSQHIAIELVLTIMGRGRQQSCILSEHTNDEVTPIAHSVGNGAPRAGDEFAREPPVC